MDALSNLTTTASSNLSYIGTAAIGGYAGAYLQAKWKGVTDISPMGSYEIESLIAGGVGAYLWLLLRGPLSVDTQTLWKGLLVGWGAEFLYNRSVRGMLVQMNVVSA